MESASFIPKGGDGASTEDNYHIEEAVDTFKAVSQAIVNDEVKLAAILWEQFVTRVGDDVNPFGAFVQAGILTTATAIRVMANDPNPTGPPCGEIEIMAIAWNKLDETIVDMEELDVASAAITYACNWEWEKLNELMSSTVSEHDDDEFLQQLGAVIMSIFVGVGGLESVGRGGS